VDFAGALSAFAHEQIVVSAFWSLSQDMKVQWKWEAMSQTKHFNDVLGNWIATKLGFTTVSLLAQEYNRTGESPTLLHGPFLPKRLFLLP
jgi:hypothetical protein